MLRDKIDLELEARGFADMVLTERVRAYGLPGDSKRFGSMNIFGATTFLRIEEKFIDFANSIIHASVLP